MQFLIKRPVATLMFYGALLLLGGIASTKLRVSLFPEISFPKISILTAYPDVSPEEMENLITKPVEEAVSSVNGVKNIKSHSEEGLSVVEVQLEWKASMDMAVINLRQKLDFIKSSLPQDSGKPILIRFDPSGEPIILLIAKPENVKFDDLRDYLDKNARHSFERIEGVSSVSLMGGRKSEISADLDLQKLHAYGLSIDHIARIMQSANYEYPAGNVKSGTKEYTVRFLGNLRSIEDIKNISVSSGSNGNPVFLHQIANVRRGYKDQTGTTLYDKNPSIIVGLKKEPDRNTVETAANIRHELEKINGEFGKNVKFELLYDSSVYISDAIASVINSIILGGIIAFTTLLFFLGDISAALIIAVSIPVSITVTLFFMYAGNVSLNIMSLGGLSLGTGMLVDNAIVSIESIQNEIRSNNNQTLLENVITGTMKVKESIIASTLTSIIIFIPIIFVSGIAGEIFSDLAYTVTFSLLSSLLSSLTLIPVLASFDLSKHPAFHLSIRLNHFLNPAFFRTTSVIYALQNQYIEILEYAFNNKRKLVIFCSLITLAGIALFFIPEKSLFPDADSGILYSEIELPEGTALEDSEIFFLRLHEFIKNNALCIHSITNIGYDADDLSSLAGGIKKANHAENHCHVNKNIFSTHKAMSILENSLSDHTGISAHFRIRGDPLEEILGESKNEYRIEIESRDRTRARNATDQLLKSIKDIDGITFFQSSAASLDPEIKIDVNREKLAANGLHPSDVGSAVRNAVQGIVPTIFREKGNEINIRLRLKSEDRNNPEKLKQLFITKSDGGIISLKELINITESSGHAATERENQNRIEYITLNIKNNYDEIIKQFEIIKNSIEIKNNRLPAEERVRITFKRANQETVDSLENLAFAFLLSIILIYQLLAAQFESFIHPFTLALSIPMMLFGVSISLLISGNGINISSAIGIILLVGIVVNSAIILYEFIRQNMKYLNADCIKNTDKYDDLLKRCIIKSASIRLRPILLTTCTTVFGMAPMAVSISSGASPQAPMAVAVIGGLASSTLLTLVSYPVFFHIIEMKIWKYKKGSRSS